MVLSSNPVISDLLVNSSSHFRVFRGPLPLAAHFGRRSPEHQKSSLICQLSKFLQMIVIK
jgi:hypothetical protein